MNIGVFEKSVMIKTTEYVDAHSIWAKIGLLIHPFAKVCKV